MTKQTKQVIGFNNTHFLMLNHEGRLNILPIHPPAFFYAKEKPKKDRTERVSFKGVTSANISKSGILTIPFNKILPSNIQISYKQIWLLKDTNHPSLLGVTSSKCLESALEENAGTEEIEYSSHEIKLTKSQLEKMGITKLPTKVYVQGCSNCFNIYSQENAAKILEQLKQGRNDPEYSNNPKYGLTGI